MAINIDRYESGVKGGFIPLDMVINCPPNRHISSTMNFSEGTRRVVYPPFKKIDCRANMTIRENE